jgi:hypothetical protein
MRIAVEHSVKISNFLMEQVNLRFNLITVTLIYIIFHSESFQTVRKSLVPLKS